MSEIDSGLALVWRRGNMAKFCTQCGRKLMDGEVCDCMKKKSADQSSDRTVVLNSSNAQHSNMTAEQQQTFGSPEQNDREKAQADVYQGGHNQSASGTEAGKQPQNQQWQGQPQGQWQNGPQGQPQGQWQGQPQGQPQGQWQNGPQGQPQGQWQGQPQGQPQGQWQNGPQSQPQGQWQNGPQGQSQGQWQNGPQGQWQGQSQGQSQGQWQNGPQWQNGQQWQNGPQWQNGNQSQWFNDKKDKIVRNAKNLFAEIVPLIKKPDSTLRELAKSNNSIISLQMIGLRVVMMILMILMFAWKFSLPAKLKDEMGDYAEMFAFPTFKLILVSILLIVAGAYLLAALLKAFSGKMNQVPTLNQTLLTSGVSSLIKFFAAIVDTLVFLICFPSLGGLAESGSMSALASAGERLKAGIWIFALFHGAVAIVTTVFEFKSYQVSVNGDEDKKMYTYILAKAIASLIIVLVAYFILKGMVSDGFSQLVEEMF